MRILQLIVVVRLTLGLVSTHGEDLSTNQAAAAKKIYTSKCARCHKFYEPTSYEDQEWHLWMGKMRKKARLSAADYDLLCRYLEQLRSEGKSTSKVAKPD